jgi:DNA mismatch repair protein MutS2
MFQSGLHVPAAAGTELPCLTGIYADIGDEQSLSQSLSTFSGHIRNIVPILSASHEQTLVLLDELGAGTDPAEGAALGEAILDELRQARSLVLVTTHLGNLKNYAFSHGEVENASMAFDTQTLEPTFQLLVGQPGGSHAFQIAKRHGMPLAVVGRAESLMSKNDRRADELVAKLLDSRLEAERRREASARLLVDSEQKLVDAELALTEARDSKARVESEAESEVDQLLRGFSEAARPHLNALKNVPRALLSNVEALEQLLKHRLRTKAFSERRREFLAGLKRYDQVWVPRFAQLCRIEKFNRADERLSVKVGEILMEIPFDDVSWVTPPGVK